MSETLQVEANGRTLHYVEEGQGQPLLLVHGGMNDYRIWKPQMNPFGQKFHVIAYSRRNSCPNEWTGDGSDSTVQNNSQDLVGLIEKLGIAPVHLVGHSFGGTVAIECALRRPELVRSLVLHEPGVFSLIMDPDRPSTLLRFFVRHPVTAMSMMREYSQHIRPTMKLFERGDFEKGVSLLLEGVTRRKDALASFPPEMQQMIRDNVKSVLGEFRDSYSSFTREDARRISVPTLLIKGEMSPRPGRVMVDELGKCMPNSEVVEIPGVSHDVIMTAPDEFNKCVLDFLGKAAAS